MPADLLQPALRAHAWRRAHRVYILCMTRTTHDETSGVVLALGEALVEFLPVTDPGAGAAAWERFAGGAPVTYAAAVVRFGRTAALVSRFGQDAASEFLLHALMEEGVDVSRIVRVPDRQMGLCFHQHNGDSTELLFQRSESAATTLEPADLNGTCFDDVVALHVPGTTMQISLSALQTCLAAIASARSSGRIVSFDPNIRDIGGSTPAAAFEQATAASHIVTPTQQEAEAITGQHDAMDAARALRDMGPDLVAVTLAADGCIMFAAGDSQPVHCPGFVVPVVEPTGAGDCHAAATMVGYLAGWDPPRIGAFANAAGALAVTARGHLGEALPTLERIEALIHQQKVRQP